MTGDKILRSAQNDNAGDYEYNPHLDNFQFVGEIMSIIPILITFSLWRNIYGNGVTIGLTRLFTLIIHGERFCVLGEMWKDADGDQLLLCYDEDTIWYYAHEQDLIKPLCSSMIELLEKELPQYLKELNA